MKWADHVEKHYTGEEDLVAQKINLTSGTFSGPASQLQRIVAHVKDRFLREWMKSMITKIEERVPRSAKKTPSARKKFSRHLETVMKQEVRKSTFGDLNVSTGNVPYAKHVNNMVNVNWTKKGSWTHFFDKLVQYGWNRIPTLLRKAIVAEGLDVVTGQSAASLLQEFEWGV